jgi:hypothetical protein
LIQKIWFVTPATRQRTAPLADALRECVDEVLVARRLKPPGAELDLYTCQAVGGIRAELASGVEVMAVRYENVVLVLRFQGKTNSLGAEDG